MELQRNELTGELILGDLDSLRLLQLAGNQLTGEIPKSIGRLKLLLHLHLEENRFKGPMPSELLDLQHLMTLHLSGNALKGQLPELQRLENLQTLELGNNFFHGEVPELPATTLEVVDLSHNNLVAWLKKCLAFSLGSCWIDMNFLV